MSNESGQQHRLARCVLFVGALLVGQAAVAAHSADGFDFPKTIAITGERYQLCSSSDMQFYVFVDIGDVALYLANCHHHPLLDQGRLLYFHYEHNFSAKDFRKSSRVLLKRNLSAASFAALKPALTAFNRHYRAAHPGDSYVIGTNKNNQLMLFLNGTLLGKTSSPALVRDYFRIWFGDKPFDKTIKQALIP